MLAVNPEPQSPAWFAGPLACAATAHALFLHSCVETLRVPSVRRSSNPTDRLRPPAPLFHLMPAVFGLDSTMIMPSDPPQEECSMPVSTLAGTPRDSGWRPYRSQRNICKILITDALLLTCMRRAESRATFMQLPGTLRHRAPKNGSVPCSKCFRGKLLVP